MKARSAVLVCLVLAAYASPADDLVYHPIRTDRTGMIIPWYSPEPGVSYDHVIRSVWNFWRDMKSCPNGVKYYMQHQVWTNPDEDSRGIGGDQIAMALSSWSLLYAYLGDAAVTDNMRYMADYYIEHSFSPPTAAWPNLPFPYNFSGLHTGTYDGDMKAGKGFLQPDKAGSFASELLTLYKMTGTERYLKTAVTIADVLAAKVVAGDANSSPWPYRVHAETGKVSLPYTTNWTGTLRLFEELIRLRQGNVPAYEKAHKQTISWLKQYPMRTNKWGPFFEDVPGWSDSEINADTMAHYILDHPGWGPDWRSDARGLLDWSRMTFGNLNWSKYGVTVLNEQTAYRVPGNSHTSRHAAVQLIYADKTGDTRLKAEAIRQLHWATYMVDGSGKNCYPYDDVWLTDGYGDYVRHYLRAMAADPELAPAGQDHLLGSTSVLRQVAYGKGRISYTTFDTPAREVLRVAFAPGGVTAGGVRLGRAGAPQDLERGEGYSLEPLGQGGILRIRHDSAADVVVSAEGSDEMPALRSLELSVPQNESRRIRLEPPTGIPAGAGVSYRTGKPSHGTLTGSAPDLVFNPEPDYQGTDVFSYWAHYGGRETAPAQVRITIARPNLARTAGVVPFVTESPQSGAQGIFVLLPLIDDDLVTSVNAGSVVRSAREVALGLLWPDARSIRQIVLRMGSAPEQKGGTFEPLGLQVTSDGAQWTEAPDVTAVPPLPWRAEEAPDAIFTFGSPVAVRGVRVVGRVPDSAVARIRELQAYGGLASAEGPRIEYQPASRTVSAGEAATFGVRTRGTAILIHRWQRSTDGGKTWEDLPGACGSYYLVSSPTAAENGNQFRCIVSNGTLSDAVSHAATLTVR